MKDAQVLVWSVMPAVPLNLSAFWEHSGRMHQEMTRVLTSLVVLPVLLEAASPKDHSCPSTGAMEDHPSVILLLEQACSLGQPTAEGFIRVWHL